MSWDIIGPGYGHVVGRSDRPMVCYGFGEKKGDNKSVVKRATVLSIMWMPCGDQNRFGGDLLRENQDDKCVWLG